MGTRPTSEYTPYLRSISFRSDLPVDSATDHPRILTVETRIAKMSIKTVFLLIKQNPELYGLLKLSPKSNQEAYREYSSVLPPFPNRQDAPPHEPFSVYGFIKDNATIIRRFIPRFPLSSSPSSPIQTGPSLACHNGRQENPVRHDAQKSTRNQNSPAKS